MKDAPSDYRNQHATIESRPNPNTKLGGVTETVGREDAFDARIETSASNATTLNLRVGAALVSFSGREARTLQRLLNKHYTRVGVVAYPGVELE